MTIPAPYDYSVSITTTGGGSRVPSQWKEADFTCRVTDPNGQWLNLDDHERYRVASESFASSATQWRRNQVQGPYTAGKFTTYAVPDQVTETFTVYVLGDSQTELQRNLADLIDTFSQPAFQLVWSVDESSYAWDCEAADYTIDFTNVNMFARNLTVKFQVLRQPAITMGSLY